MKRADFLSLPRVVVMTALAMGAPVTIVANRAIHSSSNGSAPVQFDLMFGDLALIQNGSAFASESQSCCVEGCVRRRDRRNYAFVL
ncbi:MAG: hypothetical protein BGO25_03125 [Acidobacteriales bacterium 59-55]|nr:MAG: hypothetical protein BGO25_03125 [Acidobacteriales bacterium 59-55]